MSIVRLILRNIAGSGYRSLVVFICAALMAGFAVSATVLIRGAGTSLQLALDRLGADIIVIPDGNDTNMENAFLMGKPATMWMPGWVVERIANIPGIAKVSPQLFLATLRGAACCAVPDMFLVGYDPETDFTLKPWLEQHQESGLQLGEAIGGSYVFLPEGTDNILIYGYDVHLTGNLDPTGTGLDQSMFFTFETANEISRQSEFKAEKKMEIQPDSVSSVMVKVTPGVDPHLVAQQIESDMPMLEPVEATNLFRTHRDRLLGLLRSVAALLGITWLLSMALIGLIFSIIVHNRRREIGVMRAIGATGRSIFITILAEGVFLALFGGLIGIGIFLYMIHLFRGSIIQWMGIPFIFPAPAALLGLVILGLGVALITVIPAMFIPAMRIISNEPAMVMRE